MRPPTGSKTSSTSTRASAATAWRLKPTSSFNSPAARVPQPTKITNVYAMLKGTDPANAGRIYVVTGHYDSRNSDIDHAKGAAPGANDDASGTAVSLECARVLSKHRFPATIIFLTVAGEEQGLYGSAHFAEMAKAVGWNHGGGAEQRHRGRRPHARRHRAESARGTCLLGRHSVERERRRIAADAFAGR